MPQLTPYLVAVALGLACVSDASAELFVKFSGIDGQVSDRRHTGWTNAISWSPAMAKGQHCPKEEGTINCLNRNGHRLTIQRHPDGTSPALRHALETKTPFDTVVIEDYEAFGSNDFSASTKSLSGVRIVGIVKTTRKRVALEAVTLVYERLSHTASWDESEILGLLGRNKQAETR